jgi:hypothetical protein
MVGGIKTLPTCLVTNDRITKAKTGMKGRCMIQSESMNSHLKGVRFCSRYLCDECNCVQDVLEADP